MLESDNRVRCKDCGDLFPCTEDYFYVRHDKNRKPYFRKECKKCFCAKTNKRKIANRESVLAQRRKHYKNNKEKILKQNRVHRDKVKNNPAFREHHRLRAKKWYRKDIEASREYHRKRSKLASEKNRRKTWKREKYANDLEYKLSVYLRNVTRKVLSKRGVSKTDNTLSLLGCTVSGFRRWIESQFDSNMTWDNHKFEGWHIDHIRPLASVDLSDPESQRSVMHFTNLRPLWGRENMSKKDKLDYVIDYQI